MAETTTFPPSSPVTASSPGDTARSSSPSTPDSSRSIDLAPTKPPVVLLSLPRSLSTALLLAFSQLPHLQCIHEPLGDAYYFGPERLSPRYLEDTPENREIREKSGFSDVTFNDVISSLLRAEDKVSSEGEGRRVFIKDISCYYASPPSGPSGIPTSLSQYTTFEDATNPTLLPNSILQRYKYIFLIRTPLSALPSYYRCTIPPLSEKTGFDTFLSEVESGYREMRILISHLLTLPNITEDDIVIVDADDLLADPEGVLRYLCQQFDEEFRPEMVNWGPIPEELKVQLGKWEGFHDDALQAKGIRKRTKERDCRGLEERWEEWVGKFGEDGAREVKQGVEGVWEDWEWVRERRVRF